MIFLLDTNIVSEFRKNRPHGAVLAWRRSIPDHQLGIPAIVVGELQTGVERTRKQNPVRAAELNAWVDQIMEYYTIVAADGSVYREWARLIHGRSPDSSADAMIAATARVMGLTVATRNVKDFAQFDVRIFNPFDFKQGAAH